MNTHASARRAFRAAKHALLRAIAGGHPDVIRTAARRLLTARQRCLRTVTHPSERDRRTLARWGRYADTALFGVGLPAGLPPGLIDRATTYRNHCCTEDQ
jgi:hypothetical protein